MASVSSKGNAVRYLANLANKIEAGKALRVGFLENSGTEPGGASMVEVATINEFGRMVKMEGGSYFQLPRPAFRNAIAKKRQTWGNQFQRILTAVNLDGARALGLLGEVMKGDIQQSYRELQSPPLAESTIKAKGFSKPLINKGNMVNAVDYDLVEPS